jgi:uncharacterized protein YegL
MDVGNKPHLAQNCHIHFRWDGNFKFYYLKRITNMERQARQSRPQLVCLIVDDSGSMSGQKAQAASEGIQEMILECKARGPKGEDKSYFKVLLITFGTNAQIHSVCDMKPVRKILDSELKNIRVFGSSGGTNITQALELAYDRISVYMKQLEQHAERKQHPLPLVILFSDGEHNEGNPPQDIANRLRRLCLDGEPVVIACAGISIGEGVPDEATLKQIASQGCYVHVTKLEDLKRFISTVGSSGMSSAKDISKILGQP